MRKALPVLILLCALLLGACGARAEESYSLTLWYTETDPLADPVIRLVEAYNRERGRDALAVTVRGWTDEEHLLSALQSGARPALVLCTHALAFTLQDRDMLRDLPLSGPSYPAWLCDRSPCVGHGFFPIGSELDLLCAQAGFSAALPELLEQSAAYGRENAAPCLSVERFAPLFYQVLLDAGVEFSADSQRDVFSENYVNLYNALAEAVFDGGLTGSGSLDTSCRIASSTALRTRDLGACRLSPLSDGPLLAVCRGLAVTVRDTRMQRALPDFLRWLMQTDRLSGAALESGLIPAAEDPLPPRTDLEAELVLLQRRILHLPDPGCSYYVNQSSFETEFRAALELLH